MWDSSGEMHRCARAGILRPGTQSGGRILSRVTVPSSAPQPKSSVSPSCPSQGGNILVV